MDVFSFLAGVLVGILICLIIHLFKRRPPTPPPTPPDDGITLEFVIGEVREQPTPTRSGR